jgi:hypothetical protein
MEDNKIDYAEIPLPVLISIAKNGIAANQARWDELNAMSFWERLFARGKSKSSIEIGVGNVVNTLVTQIQKRPEEFMRDCPEFALALSFAGDFDRVGIPVMARVVMQFVGVSEELQHSMGFDRVADFGATA